MVYPADAGRVSYPVIAFSTRLLKVRIHSEQDKFLWQGINIDRL